MRWFFPEPLPFNQLRNSFAFSSVAERTDFYLLRAGEKLGIKWREGNIEIKQQQEDSRMYQLRGLAGEIETWKKWSFSLAKRESYDSQLEKQPTQWLPIQKRRQTAQFAYDISFSEAQPVTSTNDLPNICELEVTQILINGKSYSTLGLEASGENTYLRENLISTIDYILKNSNLEGLDLSLSNSNNYARWIHSKFNFAIS